MNRLNAMPGEVIDMFSSLADYERNSVVIHTRRMEISRLHLESGRRIPTYEAQGEAVILCVAGKVEVNAIDESHVLSAGQLLYLLLNEPFSLLAIEESSLLITVVPAVFERPEVVIGRRSR